MVVKLKITGINKVMTSNGARGAVIREAKRMAQAAGEGFEWVEVPHKWTARAYVRTADEAGRERQANDKVLERTVHP